MVICVTVSHFNAQASLAFLGIHLSRRFLVAYPSPGHRLFLRIHLSL